jgi:hypothetical protein
MEYDIFREELAINTLVMDMPSGNQALWLGHVIRRSKSAMLVSFAVALSIDCLMLYSLKTTNPIVVVFRLTTSR